MAFYHIGATFLVCYYPIVVIVLSTSSLSRSEPLCWVRFILPQLIRQLTPYPRMPVRWHTCLLPQGEQPLTVAPCTLRHRFCISSACPSSLLWVHPTPVNALVWLSHTGYTSLLLFILLSQVTQNLVGF
jgi:hypothetical protein